MPCEKYSSDQDYVEAIRAGGSRKDHASGCLYKRDHRKVVHYLQNYVGHHSGHVKDIRDLIQDAFLMMLKKIELGGYNGGSLIHFWIGIAKGLLRNKSKRDSKTDLVDDNLAFESVAYDTPENWIIEKEKKSAVHKLLDLIGDRCKTVLLLWAEGYSMEEIAVQAGLSSEAMARKTKFKCKKKLVEFLRDKELDI